MMDLIVYLILFFPLIGFLILGLGYRTIPHKWTAVIGPGTILISFIFSLVILINFHYFTTSPLHHLFSWIAFSGFNISFEFLIDPLSILMMLIITGVGFIIHVYSVGYMKGDEGYNRFFSYMNLFVFFMLLLVMGANYMILFIGWEGVGLCSYLLIGFWFKNQEFNNAAKKAFIMNRIGDLGFLLGMFLIFTTFQSLSFSEVFARAGAFPAGEGTIVLITLLLLVGAFGKSAQIPLYTWLPDAMAGPTPVSALIHAATMVTAGVYMVARSNILFLLAPATMSIMGIIGILTALLAASIAIFQNDIKKILAYSTISQLGIMFAGLSVGAFTGAMFHLTTHAFFKALLFLAAGSVIHLLGGTQDIRKMGGLKKSSPWTYRTFLIGTLAIAGIPPLSGFFSKDEILARAFESGPLIWILLLAGSLMTVFYMFRLLLLAFGGEFRGTSEQKEHLHESPFVMIMPLALLGFLAIFGGMINLPGIIGGNALLEQFLSPVFAQAGHAHQAVTPLTHSTEWILMGVTLAGILAIIYWTFVRYSKQQHGLLPDDARRSFIVRLISKKFYIDELYDLLFVKPLLWLSGFLHRIVEVRVIDGIVNGIGNLVIRAGNTIRYLQTGNIGFYLFMMILGIILILLFNVVI
jgi:NADH-quinone oxidoreductase subunit L